MEATQTEEVQCLIDNDTFPENTSHLLQSLFETESIKNGTSVEILDKMGGINELIRILKSDLKRGIQSESLEERTKAFGKNNSKPPQQKSFSHCVWKQMMDFCIKILFIAAMFMLALALISEDPFESVIQAFSILLAIVAVVLIGAVTDFRKEKQFIALYQEQEEADKKIFTIIRDGTRKQCIHTEKVVGDLVQLSPGDSVTVDGIFLRGSSSLEVDESMLTGLSESLLKYPCEQLNLQGLRGSQKSNQAPASGEELNQSGECFIRAGSNIFDGFGLMLVCCVGDNTFSSRSNKSNDIVQEEHHQTPLQISVEKLAKQLVFVGCMSALFMFIVLDVYTFKELRAENQSFFSQEALRKVLSDVLSAFLIIVLSIPEGLPLLVTLSLAFSMNRLKNDGVIVRNLQTCQVLGAIEIICMDKTGTLTKNNVAVSKLYQCGQNLDADHIDSQSVILRCVSEALIANNTAKLGDGRGSSVSQRGEYTNSVDQWNGNRMDVTMMEYLEKKYTRQFLLDYQGAIQEATFKLVSSQDHKQTYTAAALRYQENRVRILLKGKPSEILSKCSKQISAKQQEELFFEKGNTYTPQIMNFEEIDLQNIQNIVKIYSEQSFKTVCIAYKDFDSHIDLQEEMSQNDFTFIGVLALQDDIREDADELIQNLRQGHIEVKIITGDTRLTAVNTAFNLKVLNEDTARHEIERRSQQTRIGQSSILDNEDQDKGLNEKQVIIPMELPSLVLNYREYQNLLDQVKHSEKEVLSQDLKDIHSQVVVLADADQEQKLSFVQQLMAVSGQTIGYVGDGNNDAKSLKEVHVAFAPATTATSIAKECSGVLLMQDRLLGIVSGIKWGRNIFLNIRRFIYFQLTFYFTSIAVMLVSSLTLRQQPYSVLEVIWMSLVQDIFSAIALSTECPQKNILKQTQPFKRGENLIDSYLLKLILTQALYQASTIIFLLAFAPYIFGVEPSNEHNINEIGALFASDWAIHFSIVYHLTSLFMILNLLNARRLGADEYNILDDVSSNKTFIYMIMGVLCVHFTIIYYGGKYFKTAPLTLYQNLVCIILAFGSVLTFLISKKMYAPQRRNI